MNIIEAIKSGKRFRRPYGEWTSVDNGFQGGGVFTENGRWINAEDILTEDWEIEEEKITITRSQLEEAWKIHLFNQVPEKYYHSFAKELGFEK